MEGTRFADWSVCYGAIAREILKYKDKDDRSTLVGIVRDAFKGDDCKNVVGEVVKDVDPFTIFMELNKGKNVRKNDPLTGTIGRIDRLANRLEIDKEKRHIYGEIDYVPLLTRTNSYDYYNAKNPSEIEKNIEILWKLFESVLRADDDGKLSENDEEFTKSFTDAINIKGNGASKITMGLAWVAPKVCLSLDNTVISFIYGEGDRPGAISQDAKGTLENIILKHRIGSDHKSTKTGRKYLDGNVYVKYANAIRDYLERGEIKGCTNFMDVSVAAWLENGDSIGDEDSGAGEEDSGKDDNTKEAGEPDQSNTQDDSEQNNRQEGAEGNTRDAAAGDSAAKHIRPDDDESRCLEGENILYYGVPGSGKSHEIDEKIEGPEITAEDEEGKKKQRKDLDSRTERVVFHPDYTYSDFIGQIMPRVIRNDATSDGRLVYEFVPGPFTSILKKALYDPEKKYYLKIEEINRGNAPAIFGDVFQLLDRDDKTGGGSYSITNRDIQEFIDTKTDENGRKIEEEKKYIVMIPSNLWIYATMNTSDQNVFTLDTAFQRRWDMRLVKNDFNKTDKTNWTKSKIGGSEITWGAFGNVVNSMVLDVNKGMLSSEDKRLGVYFIRSKDELKRERFPEKVLKYLWDDAFRNNRYAIFKEKLSSLEDVITVYENTSKGDDPLKAVLRVDVYDKMLKRSEENSGETSQSGTPVYQSTADDDANADGDSADRIDDDGE